MKQIAGCLFLIFLIVCAAVAEPEPAREKRAPIWVYLEPVPGTLTKEELKAKLPPIQELDALARFVIGGMVYGWRFTYTPSDRTRGVDEYFSLEPIDEIKRGDPRFTLSDITPEYPRLTCWAIVTLDDSLKRRNSYWDSILFKTVTGRGRGERTDETEGIRKAYTDAVRDAVRSYGRKLEKNKPKEMRGEVLLRENPRLYVDEGQFIADIKILVNIQDMTPYTTF